MIPKISFPIEKLQMKLLYQDAAALATAKANSPAKTSLSKVRSAYHDLYFPAPSDERPYIFGSMVLSMDGKMAFQDNPQGPVVASANWIDRDGGLADFWILNVLRAHADAIIVGAKTLQAEPDAIFSCFDADLVAERKGHLGKTRECPLNIIVSLDGEDVPFNHPIYSVPEIQTVIATCRRGGCFLNDRYGSDLQMIGPFNSRIEVDADSIREKISAAAQAGKKVVLMTGEDEPDAKTLMYILRKIGIAYLLIESPTYMWLLMSQQMLDEFFVNYSTVFIGGPITPDMEMDFLFKIILIPNSW